MVREKVVSNIHHANNKKIQQRGMRGKLPNVMTTTEHSRLASHTSVKQQTLSPKSRQSSGSVCTHSPSSNRKSRYGKETKRHSDRK